MSTMIYPAAALLLSLQLGASSASSTALFVPPQQRRGAAVGSNGRSSSRLVLSSTTFETAQGINTAATNGEIFNNGFAAPNISLESSPSLQNFLTSNGENVADWPGLNEALSNHQKQHQQQQQQQQLDAAPALNDHDSGNNARVPVRVAVTGREKRAGWESYAPARGTTFRQTNASFGGVVGSPGGVGDWRFTSSYGPATTSASAVSAASFGSARGEGYSSSASGLSANDANNFLSNNNVQQKEQQPTQRYHGHVMTGAERRAGFDSFSPFAPAHETRKSHPGIAAGSSAPSQPAQVQPAHNIQSASGQTNYPGQSANSDAEAVAATLSALPDSYHGEVEPTFTITSPGFEGDIAADQSYHNNNNQQIINGGSAIMEDTAVEDTVEVPMDTPARQSLPPYLSLRPIPGKGLGVITHKPFFKGEFVGNYEGEIMDEETKDRRYLSSLQDTLTQEDREWIQSRLERGQTLTGCYLYGVDLDNDNIYGRFNPRASKDEPPPTPKRIFVDAEDEYESLWTRFINHASPPNNNVNPKSVPESYDGKPRVWFMANRDIEEGEEICFDYGDDYWLEDDEVY